MMIYELIWLLRRPKTHGQRERERQQACFFLLATLWLVCAVSLDG